MLTFFYMKTEIGSFTFWVYSSFNYHLLYCILEPKAVATDKNRAEAPPERKAKEVPSDPRRRRRTSESSSTTNQKDSSQAPITPKKSPRHDEPASKLRKTGSRSALNTITRKLTISVESLLFLAMKYS